MMETINFIKDNQTPTLQNSELPKALQNSKSVYLCGSWMKICFVICLLTLILLREIFFLISEKHLETLLNLMILNQTDLG